VPGLSFAQGCRRTDRFAQFAVFAAHQALLDSGWTSKRSIATKSGVFIGSGIGGLHTTEEQHTDFDDQGAGPAFAVHDSHAHLNMASGLFSMFHDLRGPNLATCSACATATHAIGEAWRTIKMGDARVMFAGGSEATIIPLGMGGFCAMRALSTRNDDPQHASRPFDRDRDGFVMGEGGAWWCWRNWNTPRRAARAFIAEIVGYGNTADAHHLTSPSPGGEGAARCMRMALRSAGLNPSDISYINAHGTSTPQGDIARRRPSRPSSAHAKNWPSAPPRGDRPHAGRGGAVEMAVCVKAIQCNIVPPTINLEKPRSGMRSGLRAEHVAREMKVNAIINNSFGFGGHNALPAPHPDQRHAVRSAEKGAVENLPEFGVRLRHGDAMHACDANVALLFLGRRPGRSAPGRAPC
jgi:3-oxoacyl-[acyl-carrier-protein] synthase II